ncbi:MAG TPA: CoA-binding protein [Spirochaetota bacterium]|nr:CoA-binding protein [Spirochaetota bacterium]
MKDTTRCEMPDANPPEEEITALLRRAKTIAVVGLSDKPDRDSHRVAAYLQARGYRIIPVNPVKAEILGEKCYPDLRSIPEAIDIVDIFRAVEAIPGIVDEAIAVRAGAVWMQLGLAHRESAERARAAGIAVVQSKCIKIEHARVFGAAAPSGARSDEK